MHKKRRFKLLFTTGAIFMLVALSLIIFNGCHSAHKFTLYLTSSLTGSVYTFDMATNRCSEDPVFDYGTDAGDHVYFYNDRGYIAAASFDRPELVTFDPNSSPISPSTFSYGWVGGPSDIVFINDTKAYVSDVGNFGLNNGGVFIFDPLDTGTDFQEIAGIEANCQGTVYIASKNKVYVANSGSNTVFVIDTTTNSVNGEITVAENPKSIVALDDGSKIYVGCYIANEIWEVDTSTDVAKSIISETSETWAMAIEDTKVYYSGWSSGPCYIDVSEESPTETPITTKKGSGANLLIYNNKLYMSQPDFAEGQSTLTVVDLSDNSEINGSPFNVGTEGDAITGLAVY